MQPFPIHAQQPPAHTAALPAACDVVVIGGGIMGVMTAWFFTLAGQKVVLCEKGRVAGEQSGRNWGWIGQQARDPDELPIMAQSLALWRRLANDLGPGRPTGHNIQRFRLSRFTDGSKIQPAPTL
jgi:glycine/D-amino acid oxidase-like deaminating enzyme